jgi:hypothetical protein
MYCPLFLFLRSPSSYYSRDHLGSVREMTDSSGNIQARYDYDPHGRVNPIQGTVTDLGPAAA